MACTNSGDLKPGVQVQRTTGTGSLPSGFGQTIQTSDDPTDTKGAAEFTAVPGGPKGGYKVWQILVIPALLLLLILILA
jgi:hypothetical protein